MPPKRTVRQSGSATGASTLDEAVLRRLEAKLDMDALTENLVEQIAAKITASMSLEKLAEQFLERKEAELTASLAERILGLAPDR